VQSSNPHLISLNLRNLQEILDPNRSMDIDVFNLGVRLIACDETVVMFEPKCHLLDLENSMLFNLLLIIILLLLYMLYIYIYIYNILQIPNIIYIYSLPAITDAILSIV